MNNTPYPKVMDVICGSFVFTDLGGNSILIENRERGQTLTLESKDVALIVERLPEIQRFFQDDYCKGEKTDDKG